MNLEIGINWQSQKLDFYRISGRDSDLTSTAL